MDFTASAITVVSSVWTLTIHLKRLIEGIKESEQKIKDLERKARSFATVIGHISDAYGLEGNSPDGPLPTPHQDKIRRDILSQLQSCKTKFKTYEDEVSKLLEDRKKSVLGKLKSAWMEKANSKLGIIEKSIAEHTSTLQSLIGLDQKSKLYETHKDVKTLLTAFTLMFDKIDNLASMQERTSYDNINPRDRLFRGPRRQDSELTLVDPPGVDLNAEEVASSQDENTRSLHMLSRVLLKVLMDPTGLHEGSINLPWGKFQNPFGINPNGARHLPGGAMGLGPGDAAMDLDAHSLANSHHLRAASFSGEKSPVDYIPLTPSKTQPSHGNEQEPFLSSRPVAGKKKSHSDLSKSSTLNRNSLSDIEDEAKAYQPTQGRFRGRTNTEKGRKLLQVIGPKPDPAFETLLETDASLEERDDNGRTPLLLAARVGNVDMVKKLLANGCDTRAEDNDKATVLHIAIVKLRWDVVNVLLEPKNITQSTSANNLDSLPIDVADKSGRTPLHVCAATGCSEKDMARVAAQLIAHKADVNAKDKGDLTPIYFAIQSKKESVVELLLREGANLNCLLVRRPSIPPRIAKILENHDSGNAPSLSSPTTGQRRRSSTKTQPESKSPKSLFSRRSSGSNT